MQPQHDLVVIGSGPAGCSAAWKARRLRPEWDIVLIERLDDKNHGVYHRMCGEGISKEGLKEIDFDHGPFVTHTITKAVEHYPGDISISSDIDGFIINRPKMLDGITAAFEREKGAVMRGEVVHAIQQEGGVKLELADGGFLTSRWVIAADGALSKVRQDIFRTAPKEMIWAEQYVVKESMPQDVIEFFYDQRFAGGYRWRFPSGENVRTGWPKGTYDRPMEVLEMHRRVIPIGELPELVSDRVALVGDAAGQVNPITFGGIRTALASGRMAAEAAAAEDLNKYQKAWKGSMYVHSCFWTGYEMLRSMGNDELAHAMEPFRSGYSFGREAYAMLSRTRYRDVYRSFGLSMKVGW